MLVVSLTKSRMNNILSSLRKILDYGNGAYLHNDMIIPKEETLSRSIIKSFIPFNFEGILEIDKNFSKVSSKISKETGISNIALLFDEEEGTLFLNYTSSDNMKVSTIIASGVTKEIDDKFIATTIGLFNYFDDIVNSKCDNMMFMSSDELDKVRLSEVVKLQSNGFSVRMSRDNVPLTGALRQTGPVPFKIKYRIDEVDTPDNIDYRLVLYVNYKDFDAIHMYSFIPY